MRNIYLDDLEELKTLCGRILNTRMMAIAKITSLMILNMRYERIMLDRSLEQHPYILVQNMIQDIISFLSVWQEASFIENSFKELVIDDDMCLEEGHRRLFQQLWMNCSPGEYEQRIQRYVH